MTRQLFWIVVPFLLPSLLLAQTPNVPNMDHEPHHHLAMENDFVKVFDVRVAVGDSIILHSHDKDTVAIAIGEQLVTIGVPGKPDVQSKNADAQVRLQRSGYVHSTHVDGDKPYHTVAVELMKPQTNFRNLCGEVLPSQPLNCPAGSEKSGTGYASKPLVVSGETEVRLVTVHPHQSVKAADFPDATVVVALDAASVSGEGAKAAGRALLPGDFIWMDRSHGREYRNQGASEARFIEISFPTGK